ncbi:uncharacterized protein LAESUDRAFT_386040 [Laetiporus sulphureus 93-53]|uniref:Uncharacterized protein n=1 Tax=Laetiporus sulphureus 93-53 TaxID=1314785 RepID=A0A165CIU9_9APHY|nr:uncharacterized protein LAESUDRAFT_386040 [Laetiporus sulphureus 93-53]KZT02889.1 hypothetical protein LAESUDRAFT_386040 [Laetiporus sulphureus 93-53]
MFISMVCCTPFVLFLVSPFLGYVSSFCGSDVIARYGSLGLRSRLLPLIYMVSPDVSGFGLYVLVRCSSRIALAYIWSPFQPREWLFYSGHRWYFASSAK